MPATALKVIGSRGNVRRIAAHIARTAGGPAKVGLREVMRLVQDDADPAAVAGFFYEWREEALADAPEVAAAIAAVRERHARGDKVDPAAENDDGRRPGRPKAAPKAVAAFRMSEVVRPGFLAGADNARFRRGRRIGKPERLAEHAAARGPDDGAAARLAKALAGTAPPATPRRRRGASADWSGAVNRQAAMLVAAILRDAGHPLRSREVVAALEARGIAWGGAKMGSVLKLMLGGSRMECPDGWWWFAGEERPGRSAAAPRSVLERLYVEAGIEVVRGAGRAVTAPWVEGQLGDARMHFRAGFMGDRLRAAAARPDATIARAPESRFERRD